jgi:Mlc titration factor MtfA (ptsG expression regulator)
VLVDRVEDRWFWRTIGALGVIGLAGLGAGVNGPIGAGIGGVLGLVGAAYLVDRAGQRSRRRRRLLAAPFPQPWHRVLAEGCDHFDRLPRELRARFLNDVRFFVDEKQVTGIGVEVDDELRLLVACSAITLSLGWPDYEWDQVAEVLLYPKDFGRDYSLEGDELAGEAHPWGTVILSMPALRLSFACPDDGFHVGLHEFAHLLDVDHTHFDGIPVGLAPARHREWLVLLEKEMRRLRHGKSVLDPYGAEDPVEFLAVAIETFFELPLLMRRRHLELYDTLAGYFGQDPAAWDEARGLSA